MFRKDIEYMLNSDWEPKVPSEKVIEKQSRLFKKKFSGSVRLSLGKVTNSPHKKKKCKKRSMV